MKKNKKYILFSACAVIVLIGIYLILDVVPDSTVDNGVSEKSIILTEFNAVDIDTVNIKNTAGEFKLKVESAKDEDGDSYVAHTTVEGYEDAPIMETLPNTIAEDCTLLTASRRINTLGTNDKEYGLDDPTATVEITLLNGDVINFSVGNLSPNGEERYLGFENDSTVYLVEKDSVTGFLYSIYDLMETTVIAENDEDFAYITVDNKLCDSPVKFEISVDRSSTSVFNIVSPIQRTANTELVRSIVNNTRSFTADKVIAYNATDKEIESSGLKSPYARLTVDYGVDKLTMLASQPDGDGNVNLMLAGGNIIYSANVEALPWITATLDTLKGENILSPVYTALKNVVIETSDDKYSFDVNFVDYVDDDGKNSKKANVKLNGKEVNALSFEKLIDYIKSAETVAPVTEDSVSGDLVLRITAEYNIEGAKGNSVSFYSNGTGKAVAVLDGNIDSYAYDTYINRVISMTKELSDNL